MTKKSIAYTRRAASWSVVLLLAAAGAGCAHVPKRNPQAIARFADVMGQTHTDAKPIDSEYQRIAEEFPEKHHLILLDIGDDALLARIHLIRSARESIDIQTFIWADDSLTGFIFDELLQAAQRGVKVRILVDALIPIGTSEYIAQMAVAHKNIELCLYRPLSYNAVQSNLSAMESIIFRMRRMNRRMHNKIIVADRRIGIAGGRNYQNKYFDRNPTFIFKDREVIVTGPAAKEMSNSFDVYWNDSQSVYALAFNDIQHYLNRHDEVVLPSFTAEERESFQNLSRLANNYSLESIRSEMDIYTVDRVEFAYDPPQKFRKKKGENISNLDAKMKEALLTADKLVIFQTPYLIYDRRAKNSIKKVRERKPNLRIIVSSNSLSTADHVSAYALSYKYRKAIYKNMGIDIYEFKPFPANIGTFVPRYWQLVAMPDEEINHYIRELDIAPIMKQGPRVCIHAKSFTVDGKIAKIGSHNFDPRSVTFNSECGIIVWDEKFASLVEESILRDIAPQNSWIVGKKNKQEGPLSKMSGTLGAISSTLPILDIWPYKYTSNFELREGMAPLPSSRHPDFHTHYKDVGQFPMVDSTRLTNRTRLIKAFAGWARPFM